MNARTAHKDIVLSSRIDGETNEMVDMLAAMQGVSHAEIVRRAVHLLATTCKVDSPHPRPDKVWPSREEWTAFDERSQRGVKG